MVITSGLFLVRKDGKILITHPTGGDHWSIPKGGNNSGETAFESAIRETFEETNFIIKNNVVYHDLGLVKYRKRNKHVNAFAICETENVDLSFCQDLKCNSFVSTDSKFNAWLPEVDEYKWVSLNEAENLLHYTQVEFLSMLKVN